MEYVQVQSFPIVMSRKDAEAQARCKGGFWGRCMLRGKLLHEVRLHSVEYFLLTFEVLHRSSRLAQAFLRDREPRRQLCRVIANGSTGGCLWAEEYPEEEQTLTLPEESVQPSSFSVEELAERGKKVAWRVLRRRVGGFPELRLQDFRSVYRPFYVALYGVPIEGTRVRYLAFAADGCSSQRAF